MRSLSLGTTQDSRRLHQMVCASCADHSQLVRIRRFHRHCASYLLLGLPCFVHARTHTCPSPHAHTHTCSSRAHTHVPLTRTHTCPSRAHTRAPHLTRTHARAHPLTRTHTPFVPGGTHVLLCCACAQVLVFDDQRPSVRHRPSSPRLLFHGGCQGACGVCLSAPLAHSHFLLRTAALFP